MRAVAVRALGVFDTDGEASGEGAEGGLAADEAHGGDAQHPGRPVGGRWGVGAEAAGDPRRGEGCGRGLDGGGQRLELGLDGGITARSCIWHRSKSARFGWRPKRCSGR